MFLPLTQDVTLSEEEKTRLAVDGECQAILEEQCPAEYNDVREEDVSRYSLILRLSQQSLGASL